MEEFHTVNEEDVRKIICKLPNKCCSLDVIPTWLLKQCMPTILPTLTKVVNISLKSGTFPTSLKQAIVTPIIKKATLDPNELKNYRPVSNIKCFSKILEKCVMSQLFSHMSTNYLLEPYQSAYKPNHGTETALLRVKNDILCALDNKKAVYLVLLDLSAAFDTIDFDVLNERLANSLGINGTVRSWIMSYLQGRNSQVSIAGNLSEPQTMDFALPQGSVVGPGMFSYYTYPLGKIIQKHNLRYHIYADDTQLYTEFNPRIPGDSVTALFKLESCITEIKEWMNVNKLKLNEDKTEFFVASSKSNLKFIHEPSLNVCGSIITSSDSVRNLGVQFDSTMSMSSHISSISRSLNYHLRNIGHIRCYIDEDTCNHALRSLVISRIDYCNSLLYGLSAKDMHKLQKVQNRAARLVFKANRREHTTPLLRELHWLPVCERIKFKLLTLAYKSKHETTPPYIQNLLKPHNYSDGNMFLRSHADDNLLVCNRTHTTYGDNAFCNVVPDLWNKLPKSLCTSNSVETFKSNLKTHLFPK